MIRFSVLVASFVAFAQAAASQFNSLDFAQQHTQTLSSYPYTNDQTIDPVSGKFVAMGFGVGSPPRMHLYEMNNGNQSSPYMLTYSHDPSVRPAMHWSGFSVCAKNGILFYFDHNDTEGNRLARLDSIYDGQATAVSDPGTMQFSRRLAIEGEGADTWIASVGQGNTADAHCRILTAVDATWTSFTVAGTITGAALMPQGTGKAGVGMSPPPGNGNPPQWIATADAVGGIYSLRLFERTGTDASPDYGYTLESQINERCVDAKFDMAQGELGRRPIVVALMRTRTATDAAQLAMFTFVNGQLQEVSRLAIPRTAVNNLEIAERGSVELDRVNKKAYFTWTGTESPFDMHNVVVGRASYDLPAVTSSASNWELY